MWMDSSVSSPRRDLYGFTLAGLTEAEQSAREASLTKARSQNSAWLRKLRNTNSVLLFSGSKKFKGLVRKGVPPELRPEIWKAFSGANQRRLEAPPKFYFEICKKAISDISSFYENQEQILLVFKEHPELCREKGLAAVTRVFTAICEYKPWLSLNPGLANIVGFMCLVIGLDKEEDAFWMGTWLKIQQGILSGIVRCKNQKLYEHLCKLDCWSNVCGPWFASLFSLALPSETVACIWDCLFCEGPKVLLRVAFALLCKYQTALIPITHGQQLAKITSFRLKRLHDSGSVIHAAFKCVGSIRSAVIKAEKVRVKKALEKGDSLKSIRSSGSL